MERIRYDEEDGSAEIDGQVPARGMRCVMHMNGYVVLKRPGRGVYSGQGRPQRYSPAQFEVYSEVFTDQQREAQELTAPGGIEANGWICVDKAVDFPVRP